MDLPETIEAKELDDTHYYIVSNRILPSPRYAGKENVARDLILDLKLSPLFRAAIRLAKYRGLCNYARQFDYLPSSVRMSRLWTSIETMAACAGQRFVETPEQAVLTHIAVGDLQWLRVVMMAKAALHSHLLANGLGKHLGSLRRKEGTSVGLEDQLATYLQGQHMIHNELPTSYRLKTHEDFFEFIAASVVLGSLKDRQCFVERDRLMMALPSLTKSLEELHQCERTDARIHMPRIGKDIVARAHDIVLTCGTYEWGKARVGPEYSQSRFFDMADDHSPFLGFLQPWRRTLETFADQESLEMILRDWRVFSTSNILVYGTCPTLQTGVMFHMQSTQTRTLYQMTLVRFTLTDSKNCALLRNYRTFPIDRNVMNINRTPKEWLEVIGRTICATSARHYEGLFSIATSEAVVQIDLGGGPLSFEEAGVTCGVEDVVFVDLECPT